MAHVPTASGGRARLRLPVLALVAALLGSACDDTDPVATVAPSDLPAESAAEDTELTAVSPTTANATLAGVAYGPTGLWSSSTSVSWGPAPFTSSQNYTDARGIIDQIRAARSMNHRLVLAMTGGPSTRYTTNGKFDMAKWKNKMNTFNTSAIKRAVAAAVADGIIIGNSLLDEPETPRWGGNITKATLDRMAAYARNIFPTLPMGVNHGPPAYRWRSSERYYKLDYVMYQYSWWVTQGNVTAWRDAVRTQANRDNVKPAFSMNLLNGGVQDRKGSWDCSGTGGKGTRYPNCRMTPDQVRNWGRALGGSGCFMLMWRYDDAFMSKSGNRQAFGDVASYLRSLSRRSCKRS